MSLIWNVPTLIIALFFAWKGYRGSIPALLGCVFAVPLGTLACVFIYHFRQGLRDGRSSSDTEITGSEFGCLSMLVVTVLLGAVLIVSDYVGVRVTKNVAEEIARSWNSLDRVDREDSGEKALVAIMDSVEDPPRRIDVFPTDNGHLTIHIDTRGFFASYLLRSESGRWSKSSDGGYASVYYASPLGF